MPEPPPRRPPTIEIGANEPDREEALRGIRAIRRSLGLGESEAQIIHEARERLLQDIPSWVDAFYRRLLLDPTAQRLLRDEARIIRLKRSLTAWFDEFFTLDFDLDFERARTQIGQAHVRIQMPPYLMVTAMAGVRRDVLSSIRLNYASDVPKARQVARAVSMGIDLELALMIESYRRQDRQLMRQKDRAIYTERAVRRLADTQRDQIDAALCYLELGASAEGDAQARHLVKLRDLLLELGRSGQPLRTTGMFSVAPPRSARLLSLCRLARDKVNFDPHTSVHMRVEPRDLRLRVHEEALQLALEELLLNAATHGTGRDVSIRVEASAPRGAFQITVTDAGSGWDAHIEHLHDVYARGIGLGLSFCELVAQLHHGSLEIFRASAGGAGVRLNLFELHDEAGDE